MSFYYLYFHRDPDTEEVVYCGIGQYDRPWQVNNRSSEHKAWLKEKMDDLTALDDIVQVEYATVKKEEALESELEYIDRVRPRFNKNYTYPLTTLTPEGLEEAKKDRASGLSYSQIAKKFQVATMTIWRALNGRTKAYTI